MGLRSKLAWILLGTCLVILCIALIDSRIILVGRFQALEGNQAQSDLYRISQAVQNTKETLRLYATSFSQWDDAYQFLQDKNQKFIDANFVEGTFTSSKINIFMFFDSDNHYFYGKAYDLKEGKFIPLPKEIVDYFLAHPEFLNAKSGDLGQVGFLQLSQLYLLASMPVLDSQGKKKSNGRLLMGYYFLPEHVAMLAHAVNLPLNMGFVNSPEWKQKGLNAIQKRFFKINSDQKTLTLYYPMYGIDGNSAGILYANQSRKIYLQGEVAIFHYLFIVVFLSFVVFGVMLLALKQTILDRILGLSRHVVEISKNASFSERVAHGGDDEIGLMSKAINHLLSIIELSQEQLKRRISQRTSELEKISVLNKNLSKEVEAQKNIEVQLREGEAVLKKMAYYDELTGLPNRTFFYELFQEAVKKSKRSQSGFALLFIDADKFKQVNDQHGHAIGDMYLKFIAKQMRSSIKNTDTLARLAGDEFVALLLDIEDVNRIRDIVAKMIEHAQQSFEVGDKKICPSVSVGIALFPRDAQDWRILMEKADLAMYQAKQSDNKRYCFYHEIYTTLENASPTKGYTAQ